MNVLNAVKAAWYATKFFVIKNAPTILTVGGTVATVAGTVVACKSTMKLKDLMDECDAEKQAIEETYENDEDYSEKEYKKDLFRCKMTTLKKLGKLYWKPIALTTVGVAGIFSGYGILNSRNVKLGAALLATEQMYDSYRGRVKDILGEEKESQIRFPMEEKKEETEVVDEETGEIRKVEKTTKRISEKTKKYNQYTTYWGEGISRYYVKDPQHNELFLKRAQSHWNDVLNIRKLGGMPVFLNEVREDLGLEPIQIGNLVGWLNREIDFGMFDSNGYPMWYNADFFKGEDDMCLLDFNVEGNVLGALPDVSEAGGAPFQLEINDDLDE